MYPVNQYLVIEELHEDTEPVVSSTIVNNTPVLYNPNVATQKIRRYTVLDISADQLSPAALVGDTVAVRVEDVEDFFDKKVTTFDALVAVEKHEGNK